MCGLQVVVVAPRVVGDNDVRCLYVIVERDAGELLGEARCQAPCFGCGVGGHKHVDGPLIMVREDEVW